MKTADEYIARINNEEHREIISTVRNLLLQLPGLHEEIKWGVPVYGFGGTLIMYLASFKKFVTFGFYNGDMMPTEPGELLGDANVKLRSLKFSKVSDIEPEKVLRLARMSIAGTGKLEVDW